MNFNLLFDTQSKLDADILVKHPVQANEYRINKKILALQVELAECANEWRGFKFWSKDQKPRTEKYVVPSVTSFAEKKNPLLEEYVDCLHFILSIGLDYAFDTKPNCDSYVDLYANAVEARNFADILSVFLRLNSSVSRFIAENLIEIYEDIMFDFFLLGVLLGFTWDEVEKAYFEKNKINLQRQENGY